MEYTVKNILIPHFSYVPEHSGAVVRQAITVVAPL